LNRAGIRKSAVKDKKSTRPTEAASVERARVRRKADKAQSARKRRE
jgi:hypothetical protein